MGGRIAEMDRKKYIEPEVFVVKMGHLMTDIGGLGGGVSGDIEPNAKETSMLFDDSDWDDNQEENGETTDLWAD